MLLEEWLNNIVVVVRVVLYLTFLSVLILLPGFPSSQVTTANGLHLAAQV